MSYSSRIAQKASDISDGKDSFKSALRITYTFDGWSSRLKYLFFFLNSALGALFYKDLEQIIYHEDVEKVTGNMEKVKK